MDTAVADFRIDISGAQLADLRDRLGRTLWPDRETVADWSQGVPLAYVQDVCRYWAESYDWRRLEARLNGLPQYKTTLDGLGIHFLHVRSPEPDALPLVLTHGWPGSVVEFLDVIAPLADPRAHGGDPADAFHVVCPSLPGYGFSDKPTETGWGIERIANAWAELMGRLGYSRYGAQGGDWGSAVTTAIGVQDSAHCAGIHLNLIAAAPDPATFDDMTDKERAAIAAFKHYQDRDSGYAKEQSTRPQTVGYGLADSPAGQAAWILEKFWAWTDCDGHPENALTRDQMLDNIMLYWLTGSGASSARLYWESLGAFDRPPVTVPTGVSQFPKEIFLSSRRWASKAFPNIVYWNELERGGHFAAFEQPKVFVDEIRSFFRLVR
jgi:pimeloyl-ACP methyl ester carboxylesterase